MIYNKTREGVIGPSATSTWQDPVTHVKDNISPSINIAQHKHAKSFQISPHLEIMVIEAVVIFINHTLGNSHLDVMALMERIRTHFMRTLGYRGMSKHITGFVNYVFS